MRATLALVMGSYTLKTVATALLGIMFEALETALDATPTGLGLIVMVTAVVEATSLTGWGRACDQAPRVRLWVLSTLLWGSLTVALAFATSFASFLVLRAASGLGLSGLTAIAGSLIPDMFAAADRGRGFGLLGVAGLSGFIIAALLGSSIGASSVGAVPGWRILFFLVGAATFPISLVISLFAVNPERGGFESASDDETALASAEHAVLFLTTGGAAGENLLYVSADDDGSNDEDIQSRSSVTVDCDGHSSASACSHVSGPADERSWRGSSSALSASESNSISAHEEQEGDDERDAPGLAVLEAPTRVGLTAPRLRSNSHSVSSTLNAPFPPFMTPPTSPVGSSFPRVTSHPRLVSFDPDHPQTPPPMRRAATHSMGLGAAAAAGSEPVRRHALFGGRSSRAASLSLASSAADPPPKAVWAVILAALTSFATEVRPLVRNRALIALTLARAMGSLPVNALSFMVLWFQYVGLSDFGAGVSVAFAALGTILGCVVGGWLGDWASIRWPNRGRITVAQVTQVVLCIAMYSLIKTVPQDPSSLIYFIVITMFIGMLLAFPAFACDLPILAEVVRWQTRGTAYAISGLFLGLFSSIGSLLVGIIADKLFHYRARTKKIAKLKPRDKQHNLDALSNAILLLFLSSWAIVFFITFSSPACTRATATESAAPAELASWSQYWSRQRPRPTMQTPAFPARPALLYRSCGN
ncbi:major facilitator superfamily transporter protein [Thecamonas trahens ATCC 50062]|uniref:Major facilitator superfamily transporter protein n=1 Tax=Thecamonas trahens ATCC 50062 TaxID=461836 RepID=A0A0L0D784_THETB|nr:major facilitator superfamily transporter protein [Thecamonas trahens ATCC 50062]KNC48242.1 major facilitator superfamily transporter protein [Thecamonas trahens ATCC 50062]|eukprot:XP_013758811.1 major facilitator superfamily transporter protein [Thecamonas trahens ATCC 50062]